MKPTDVIDLMPGASPFDVKHGPRAVPFRDIDGDRTDHGRSPYRTRGDDRAASQASALAKISRVANKIAASVHQAGEKIVMARYEKGRKGETRRHIIELAAKRFRADGVDGVGVATLMADAGLTNGGFYAHFSSKEDLVKEAVVYALSEMPGEPGHKVGENTYDLPAFIARYLSSAHRDNPSAGCAVAALSPELTRRPAASRVAFRDEGMATIERIAAGLPTDIAEMDRLPRAFAVFSHLLGALQMARFVIDGPLSDAILTRGRQEAMRIAGFETI